MNVATASFNKIVCVVVDEMNSIRDTTKYKKIIFGAMLLSAW